MKNILLKIASVLLLITIFLQGVITEAEENGIGITDFTVVDDRVNPRINQFTIYFFLSKDSTITLKALKGSETVAALATNKRLSKGPHIVSWDASRKGRVLEEGKYVIQISESNFKKSVPVQIAFLSKPEITTLNLWPKSFTPGGQSPRITQGIFYNASEKGHIKINIEQKGIVKKRLIDRNLPAGSVRQAWWDGKDDYGNILAPGIYSVVATVTNEKGSHRKLATTVVTVRDDLPGNLTRLNKKIDSLYSSKRLSPKTYKKYKSLVERATTLLAKLKFENRTQEYLDLSYVLGQCANSGTLFDKAHSLMIEINLAANIKYFETNSLPEAWSALDNLDDAFTFVYFKERGLQAHPVATLVRLSKETDDARFLRSINKILGHYTQHTHNGVRFKTIPYQFEYMGGSSFWPSAMSQGMILPSVARAYRLTGQKHYLDDADQIMNSFTVNFKNGGVLGSGISGKEHWYLEYAFSDSLKVFNGKVIALQGLKSYANMIGNKKADTLFKNGLSQINKNLHMYDYEPIEGENWSKYCNLQYPASDDYHLLNTILLEWAATNKEQISRGEILEFYARKWRQPISRLAKLQPNRFDEEKTLNGLVKTYDYDIFGLNN